MEIYALDRGFHKQTAIDVFESAIWTERYYGDGDFEITVPATPQMLAALAKGQFMMCMGSKEPMILETREIKDSLLKVTGITLTQWLNNRFIRTSADWAVRDWQVLGVTPLQVLQGIVYSFCTLSPFLDGTVPIGIPVATLARLPIPGLVVDDGSSFEPVHDFSVPFGPVYDALKEIATTYEVGMKITLDLVTDVNYQITFYTYRGGDRTTGNLDNLDVLRFSPEMNSLTNITDLESIADYKNYLFMFPPTGVLPAYAAGPGSVDLHGTATGFDIRAFQGFADGVTVDALTDAQILNLLQQATISESINRKAVSLVDGEIVQLEGLKIGTDFFLGDIIEVEGNTGNLQKARITEYIRSQDAAGYREYPTLAMLD